MTAHDDFLDVEDAFERYGKAYAAWGRAVDGSEKNNWERASDTVCKSQATKLFKAMDYLIQQTSKARRSMVDLGWEPPVCKCSCKNPAGSCECCQAAERAKCYMTKEKNR